VRELEFVNISNFEKAIQLAQNIVKISKKDYKINFSLKVSFTAKLIKTSQLDDVVDLATDFQKIKCPKTLYLNHGHFITARGVDYVIDQLKNKQSSNRAIISLINQEIILNSGDNPIPSFMILQFSLEDNVLFVTCYFRALEVAKFLRINLEEIRLIINSIYNSIGKIHKVKLHIFAFRAYINKNINPLVRPEIELLDEKIILKLMEKKPDKIAHLLKQKLTDSTVIENRSIKIINDIVSNRVMNQDICEGFKKPYFVNKLQRCLDLCNKLMLLRKKTSHDKEISKLTKEYLSAIDVIIREIEKWL